MKKIIRRISTDDKIKLERLLFLLGIEYEIDEMGFYGITFEATNKKKLKTIREYVGILRERERNRDISYLIYIVE